MGGQIPSPWIHRWRADNLITLTLSGENSWIGLHSPTPRKVKKPMQATPRRNVQLTSKPDNIQNVPSHTEPPAKKRVAIQLFSPDKVKVIKLSALHRWIQGEEIWPPMLCQMLFWRIFVNFGSVPHFKLNIVVQLCILFQKSGSATALLADD
jgi:hypothetical protein